MIEQQIRTWEVLDQRVLNTLSLLHREDFIPVEYRKLALSDVSIPLAHGQVTMHPKVEARLVQALTISTEDKILEIGTGCAYLTAILSKFGKEVVSVDIFEDFIYESRTKLSNAQISNVNLINGDAIDGWESQAPYDVIAITGSLPETNPVIEQQLTIGGRMFVILGEPPIMDATLITRTDENHWARETLFETEIPPLVGALKKNTFQF
jgi:protein-L-isoaspartate(D-aspartate) O-methyltransferase